MATKVKWREFYENKTEDKSDICFRDLGQWDKDYTKKSSPNKVKYFVDVDKILKEEEIQFYSKFILKIFNYNFQSEKEDSNTVFVINCENLSRVEILLYLTAQRYLDEYPEIIKEFYNRCSKIKDIKKQFIIFQYVHYLFDKNKEFKVFKKKKQDNLGGHGLISYHFHSDFEPISLEQFEDNLNRRLSNVHSYFKTNGKFGLGEKYKKLTATLKNFIDNAQQKV